MDLIGRSVRDPGGPRYKHDCLVVGDDRMVGVDGDTVTVHENACRFVGRWQEYDLYVHVREWGVESIARFGDEGHDYLSGPSSDRLIVAFLDRGYA